MTSGQFAGSQQCQSVTWRARHAFRTLAFSRLGEQARAFQKGLGVVDPLLPTGNWEGTYLGTCISSRPAALCETLRVSADA